jgi:hypothetical protein
MFVCAAVAAMRPGGDIDTAKTAQFECLDRFLTVFQAPTSVWLLPVLQTLCKDSYTVADILEKEILRRQAGATNEAMVRSILFSRRLRSLSRFPALLLFAFPLAIIVLLHRQVFSSYPCCCDVHLAPMLLPCPAGASCQIYYYCIQVRIPKRKLSSRILEEMGCHFRGEQPLSIVFSGT